jgi:hypothetical protein
VRARAAARRDRTPPGPNPSPRPALTRAARARPPAGSGSSREWQLCCLSCFCSPIVFGCAPPRRAAARSNCGASRARAQDEHEARAGPGLRQASAAGLPVPVLHALGRQLVVLRTAPTRPPPASAPAHRAPPARHARPARRAPDAAVRALPARRASAATRRRCRMAT